MDLSHYPMDTQTCPFILMSYAYTTQDVQLEWHQIPVITGKDRLPISNYELKHIIHEKTLEVTVVSGDKYKFDCLILKFVVSRAILYFVYKVYIPIFLLIVFNMSSYWVPDTALPARMTLIVTTFLSSVFVLQSVSGDSVRTPTTTSLQVFVTFSIGIALNLRAFL